MENKTLLIPTEYLDEKITAENISENYPYPVEITSASAMYEAMENKDSQYAVPLWVPMRIEDKDVNRIYIGDPSNGDILGFVKGENIRVDDEVFSGAEKIKPLIKSGELQAIGKLVK